MWRVPPTVLRDLDADRPSGTPAPRPGRCLRTGGPSSPTRQRAEQPPRDSGRAVVRSRSPHEPGQVEYSRSEGRRSCRPNVRPAPQVRSLQRHRDNHRRPQRAHRGRSHDPVAVTRQNPEGREQRGDDHLPADRTRLPSSGLMHRDRAATRRVGRFPAPSQPTVARTSARLVAPNSGAFDEASPSCDRSTPATK